jgi:hypothetical protein
LQERVKLIFTARKKKKKIDLFDLMLLIKSEGAM